MQASFASTVGSSEDEAAHHAHVKEAELAIRGMVEEIIRSNNDQDTIAGLDILHKLITK
jgi:hypothetical protein